MEYKLICLLFFIANFNGISTKSDPEIVSTQHEVITYVNHTAKLSCLIQNRNQQHVTWSRVHFINETQKLTNLLYVDLIKYIPINRYHLTHLIEKDNREYWNLEIRHIHLSDEGYYSCVLTAIKPISKLFYVQVIENTRNPSVALRSTVEMQRRAKERIYSSLSLIQTSILTVFLMIILVFII